AARRGCCASHEKKKQSKIKKAGNGDIAAIGKADELKAGQWLSKGALPPDIEVELPARNARLAVQPSDRKDDVRLASAIAKLVEEDSALSVEHDEASHELRLRGVNDEHLNLVIARLKRRYGVEVASQPCSIGFREPIPRPVKQHSTHNNASR